MGLVHGPGERALDRQYAVRHLALDGRPDHVRERVHADERGRKRKEPLSGRGAVRAGAARVCDRGHLQRSGISRPHFAQYVRAAHLCSARSRRTGRSQLQRSALASVWGAAPFTLYRVKLCGETVKHGLRERRRRRAPAEVRRRRGLERCIDRLVERRGQAGLARGRGAAAARPSGAWRPGWRSRGRRYRAPSRARARRRPGPPSARLADAARPRPPLVPAATSERMSPKVFSVTIVENRTGSWTISRPAVSTRTCSSRTSGYSGASPVTTSRQRRDVSMTFALSTDASRPRRVSRQLEAAPRDALDLRRRVLARVERAAVLAAPAGAEVEPADELAHDQQVDARPARRAAGWRRRRARRAGG